MLGGQQERHEDTIGETGKELRTSGFVTQGRRKFQGVGNQMCLT